MRGGNLSRPVNVIAIDGPAAAGKTVVGRMLAHRLGFKYLDTGVMYRAIAWLARRQGISFENVAALGNLAESNQIRIEGRDSSRVTAGGQGLGDELRTPEISQLASIVAAVPTVRRAMVQQQQAMAAEGNIVMVGRDICTVVLPQADLKLFMTASVEERARRRWGDSSQQGLEVELEQVLKETKARDRRDSTREDSPLIPAEDALIVDTEDLSVEQAVEFILERVRAGANPGVSQ